MDSIQPARLIDASCHINDNITSSSINSKKPTCFLRMTIEEPATKVDEENKKKTINVELPSATLKTLVNDLSKIRDQLSNIAKK